MTAEMDKVSAAALRKAFPASAVGKLPKGGILLDYVGHAATTDRLLQVDPTWTWEPLGVDDQGLPAMDAAGNLWIRLTVCGVTRIGVGDGKNMKERIGDAIRNAAMRFGVALDLWSKEELEGAHDDPDAPVHDKKAERVKVTPPDDRFYTTPPTQLPPSAPPPPIAAKTRGQMFALFGQKGVAEEDQLPGVNHVCGTAYTSRSEITEDDAKRVIAVLKKRPDATPATEEQP